MKRGFTLSEMLVTVAIMTFIITVVISNTHKLGLNAKVKAAAGLVVDTSKDTRSKAVSVKQFMGSLFPSYGIKFDTLNPTYIRVYADCVADDNGDRIINSLDTFAFVQTSNACSGTNGRVQDVFLPSGTRIRAIRSVYPVSGVMTSVAETKMDMLFLRPEPTVWIVNTAGALLPTGYFEVDVSDTANTYTKTVRFYSTGQFFLK